MEGLRRTGTISFLRKKTGLLCIYSGPVAFVTRPAVCQTSIGETGKPVFLSWLSTVEALITFRCSCIILRAHMYTPVCVSPTRLILVHKTQPEL
jgi:hypothetical protein